MAAPYPLPLGGPTRDIRGVGPYVARRMLENYAIANTLQLANYINGLPTRFQVQNFVDDVTQNKRSCECIEGYVVRRHNRQAREGIIDWIVLAMPAFPQRLLPNYADPHSTRAPPRPGQGALVPGQGGRRFYRRVVRRVGPVPAFEGGWPYPHARPAARNLATNPAAAQGVATFPYGRHDYKGSALEAALTRAARDAILSDPNPRNAAYNRRYWPCACFKSRRTCQDFTPGRGNRPGGGLSPCGWIAGTCQEVAPPPPPRRDPVELRSGTKRRRRVQGD